MVSMFQPKFTVLENCGLFGCAMSNTFNLSWVTVYKKLFMMEKRAMEPLSPAPNGVELLFMLVASNAKHLLHAPQKPPPLSQSMVMVVSLLIQSEITMPLSATNPF